MRWLSVGMGGWVAGHAWHDTLGTNDAPRTPRGDVSLFPATPFEIMTARRYLRPSRELGREHEHEQER